MKLLTLVNGRIERNQCCLVFTAILSVEEGVPLAVASFPVCHSCLTYINKVCHDSRTRSHNGHSYPARARIESSPSLLAKGSSMVVYQTMSIGVFHLGEVDCVSLILRPYWRGRNSVSPSRGASQ